MSRERSAATEVRRLRSLLRWTMADLNFIKGKIAEGNSSYAAESAERSRKDIERALAPRRPQRSR